MATKYDEVASVRIPARTMRRVDLFAKERGKLRSHAILDLIERGLWMVDGQTLKKQAKGK